jgi:SAM-dependent methyltransferase
MISKKHPNRGAHNWLIYKVCDRFLQKFAANYKGTLYDLGAGESPYKDFFLQYAQQYIAVDWAGSIHNTKVDIAADLNQPLPIASEVADTVVALSVMEHLCEPQTMLFEAFRILKPGGAMVLQVPWQWSIHEAPYDFFRYTPYGLKYLFDKAGFTEVMIEPQTGFFTMWVLKFNYFSLRLLRGPKLMRLVTKGLLLTIWYTVQKAAPCLDRLDHNWTAESTGYFVTAKKPFGQ